MWVDLGIGREDVAFAFALCSVIREEGIVLLKTLHGTSCAVEVLWEICFYSIPVTFLIILFY